MSMSLVDIYRQSKRLGLSSSRMQLIPIQNNLYVSHQSVFSEAESTARRMLRMHPPLKVGLILHPLHVV